MRGQSRVKLGRGCDFHLSYDNIQEAKIDPRSSASTGWAICWWRFRTMDCRGDLTETFYQLQLAGLTPILTHPERNPTLQTDRSADEGMAARRGADPGDGGLRAGQDGQDGAEDGASTAGESVGSLSCDGCAQYNDSRVRRCGRRSRLVAKKYGPDYAHPVRENPLAVFEGSRCRRSSSRWTCTKIEREELVAAASGAVDEAAPRGRGRRRRRGAGR